MYADDLALVAGSPEELQAMLDIVHNYAQKWRYNLNAGKSVVMVLGETSRTRRLARSARKWTLGSECLKRWTSNTTLVYLGPSLTLPYITQTREQQLAEVPSML